MNINTKRILGWCMYDFANSPFTTIVVTFVYSAYFASGIVGNEAMGQVYWGNTITICALIIAILSPVMGAIADQGGYRKFFLYFWTFTCIFFSSLLFFPKSGDILFSLIIFSFANIAFEMGCVFYNSFLPKISNSYNSGKISGYGYSLGYVGGLSALAFGLVTIAMPDQPMFGITTENGQNFRAMNLLVAIWLLIFSIPTFIYLEKDRNRKRINLNLIKSSFNQIYDTYLNIKKIKNTIIFLVARLFYNDAMITIFSFGGILAVSIYKFELEKMLIFGIALGIAAGIGAFLMGFAEDKIGPKKTIQISNFLLIIASLMVVFADNLPLIKIDIFNITINSEIYFWIAGILVGFSSGPNQSSSRSLMSKLAPKDKQNEFFGFFSFSGKITAFIGPLLLAQVTYFSLEYLNLSDTTAQRMGVSVVLILIIIGSFILHFVDEKKETQ